MFRLPLLETLEIDLDIQRRRIPYQMPRFERRQMMHTLLRASVAATLIVAFLGVHSFSQAPDPLIGTWVLNVAKSKYSPGPAPKSETRTYVVAGSDIKASSKGTDGEGKPTAGE